MKTYSKSNEIFTTDNHSIFSKISNRKITENSKLEEELLSEGQRQPILVNSKLQVIDGQHRLYYLKKHRKPVRYIVDPTADFRTVISMNTSAVNWSLRDYVESYSLEGDPEFIKLAKFLETNDLLSDKVIITAGAGRRDGTAAKIIQKLKEGNYVFSNEKQLKNFCRFYEQLLSETKLPNKPFLQSILWTLYTTSVFDETRMLLQLKKSDLTNENIEGYSKKNLLLTFLKIYNGRWSDDHPSVIQYFINRKGTLVIPSLPKQD
ncbi:ParB N-terminal domain-containing protein [Streptococcus respiraculi]|uniref:ParB N-terminal domain-containing protein n=1 Tax=Streptococcus respiraculi TaxID=2021971 RepID=UPI000E70735D|nr:ParB N-terminal domain-containing protein [Streptococcus respiraculi]